MITIVGFNESNKFLQTEMLFPDFFLCPDDDPVVHWLNQILLCARGTRAVPGKQKALGKFCVRKRKILFSRTQKIVKWNISYTNQSRMLWLLALDLVKKSSDGSEKSAIFPLSTWNFTNVKSFL